MTEQAVLTHNLREAIISRPEALLEDRDLMRALIAANDRAMGDNVIDLRGLAMDRLEQRLERLEDTHRTVIAAAYENLAGAELVHRAVLRMLEAADFLAFLALIETELAETLIVDRIRLVLENEGEERDEGPLKVVPSGWVGAYLTRGRNVVPRRVTLRRVTDQALYGDGWRGSEACLALDLGPEHAPGLLCIGAADPEQYHQGQGTDLLEFLAGTAERMLRRWIV
ncbi:DUF484 family protein [Roseitranquillus sediminis]|uniref:DUF484 family protein n=1 Tax=Roseitranquillus sediminis TaxID=2809051 RepID=UPI001D0CB693|nr:DUF484 family protein [Roseitranquillus sediminis]MBM9596411.1 DUF484 family protein [Roseitranquillus sediminis]